MTDQPGAAAPDQQRPRGEMFFAWGRQTLAMAAQLRSARAGQQPSEEGLRQSLLDAHEQARTLWQSSMAASGENPSLPEVVLRYSASVFDAANRDVQG